LPAPVTNKPAKNPGNARARPGENSCRSGHPGNTWAHPGESLVDLVCV
jgi:hypothetical protein